MVSQMPSECLKCGHSQNQGCPGGTERQSDPGGVCSGCWHQGCNKWSDCEGSSGNCLYKRTSEWRHRRSSGGVRSYLAQKLGWCYSSKGAIFIRPVVLREMAESSRNLPQDKNIFSVVFFCAFSHEFSSLQPDRLQIASLSFHMQPRLAHSRCVCVSGGHDVHANSVIIELMVDCFTTHRPYTHNGTLKLF